MSLSVIIRCGAAVGSLLRRGERATEVARTREVIFAYTLLLRYHPVSALQSVGIVLGGKREPATGSLANMCGGWNWAVLVVVAQG